MSPNEKYPYPRIEKQLGKPIPRDESFSFIGTDSYDALHAIYYFVELQGSDVTKAQEILRNLLTITTQIEIGHDADLYTDGRCRVLFVSRRA